MKDPRIYRKEAIDAHQKLSGFQEAIKIITPSAWLYLIIFMLLFIAGFMWLILGRITTQVEGQGIIFAKNAEIINIMSPIDGGYVSQLPINPGDKIKKGQIIATVSNPNMAMEAKRLKQFVEAERHELIALRETAKKEIEHKINNIQKLIEHTNAITANLLEKKNHLASLLKIQEVAFKKGILSRLELNEMQVAFYDAKEQITKNKNTLIELNQGKNDYVESWNIKLREQQEKLEQAELNYKKISEDLQLTEKIYSPVDGIISNNLVKAGDYLTKQQTISHIITYSNELEVIAFFDADLGKKIHIGMPAKVFPKHINKLEYGGLLGKVIFISELPISPQGMNIFLENPKLVDKFIHSGPVFKVRIKLIPALTESGYQWTTSKGPNEKLTIGTVINAGIIVKQERPISLIIPIFKLKI